ncbi:hypothetical protein DFH09DRAFT_1371434 [Mycena vulgaris]|nr:hypothetical protein DFH09DRAFT_1371434 [Mycena vulgaris]
MARTLLPLTVGRAPSPSYHRRSTLLRRPRALLLIAADALTLVALTVFLGPNMGRPPPSLAAARTRYALKTSRPPPRGFDAFYAFARTPERGCLVDAYDGVHADFASFWQAECLPGRGWFRKRVREVAERLKNDPRGMTALSIRDGVVHRPDYQGTYFDEDWERTINKYLMPTSAVRRRPPPLTVLINGRDEPRVVFDALPLFRAPIPAASASTSDSATDTEAPHSIRPGAALDRGLLRAARGLWAGGRGEGYAGCAIPLLPLLVLLFASSAEFTTDLVPVLSMAKPTDGAGVDALSGAWVGGGGRSTGGVRGRRASWMLSCRGRCVFVPIPTVFLLFHRRLRRVANTVSFYRRATAFSLLREWISGAHGASSSFSLRAPWLVPFFLHPLLVLCGGGVPRRGGTRWCCALVRWRDCGGVPTLRPARGPHISFAHIIVAPPYDACAPCA